MLQEHRERRSSVTVDANGLALAIASCACVVMLILFVCGMVVANHIATSQAAEIRELRRESQTMRDYLNVIYQHAPHLKPASSTTEQEPRP